MMTNVPDRHCNDAYGDGTNTDVIMTIPTFLITFYDYSNNGTCKIMERACRIFISSTITTSDSIVKNIGKVK